MGNDYEGVFDVERGCLIVEKVFECHEAAHKLFGEKYTEKTQDIRDALQDLMKHGCNATSAGLHLLHFLKGKGKLDSMAIMLTAAVIYDLCGA